MWTFPTIEKHFHFHSLANRSQNLQHMRENIVQLPSVGDSFLLRRALIPISDFIAFSFRSCRIGSLEEFIYLSESERDASEVKK